ncbi:MAG: hypothetical protein JSW33_14040 [bacterium]|nr:MAG: hypothetical protein JSW33_14040 [bacterium]
MNNLSKIYLVVLVMIGIIKPHNSPAQEIDLGGQVSGWAVTNPDRATQLGLRYIPDLMMGKYWDDYTLDSEISLNMYGVVQFEHNQDATLTYDEFDSYRIWIRFAASQFELRAGLQKINFGSAMLLRALMWFDSIDPRDPLQLTDGVWGLSARYFFLNNTSIWFWSLYGNDQNRGWDVFASDKNSPEFGGRLQVPLLTGEFALTYHYRKIESKKRPMLNNLSGNSTIPENRIGFDGKWDIEVGVWAEAAIVHRELDFKAYNYQRQTNLGVDYTFELGNGLYAIAEYFTFSLTEKVFEAGEDVSLTALSLNYPLGLLDDLTAIVYYEIDNQDWYCFFQWQRTYDNWRFYLMGFWNPDQYQLFPGTVQYNLYAGKGVQLLLVFNH